MEHKNSGDKNEDIRRAVSSVMEWYEKDYWHMLDIPISIGFKNAGAVVPALIVAYDSIQNNAILYFPTLEPKAVAVSGDDLRNRSVDIAPAKTKTEEVPEAKLAETCISISAGLRREMIDLGLQNPEKFAIKIQFLADKIAAQIDQQHPEMSERIVEELIESGVNKQSFDKAIESGNVKNFVRTLGAIMDQQQSAGPTGVAQLGGVIMGLMEMSKPYLDRIAASKNLRAIPALLAENAGLRDYFVLSIFAGLVTRGQQRRK